MARNTTETESRVQTIERWALLIAISAALLVSLVLIKPSLPKEIVLLTGPEGSNYHTMGQRYAAALRSRGLNVRAVATEGGLENLRRLEGGAESTVALAPSYLERAAIPPLDGRHLVSLGSVAFEPLWFFFRSDLHVESLKDLAILTVSTGDDDAEVDWVARQLLQANGIIDEVTIVGFKEQPVQETLRALRDGRIHGTFMMGLPTSPAVRLILDDDRVALLSISRADAYVALYPGLTKLIAPEGVFDLARNVPPSDTQLLSATTNLVTRDSLHPTVVPLLLSAAATFYDERSVFTVPGHFPSQDGVSLPLKKAAVRYYEKGETGLSKHVSYAVARVVNHLGFVVLPLLGLAVVLVKVVPIALRLWTDVRLVGLYKKLEAVEKADATGTDRADLLADLQAIDDDSATIFVPRSKIAEYIDFRQFVHDMRDRIMSGDERKLKAEVLGSKDDS